MKQLTWADVLQKPIIGKELHRAENELLDHYPPRTAFVICLVETYQNGVPYWRPVWNKGGGELEFIDRDHAYYFLKQHPEAVGYHDWEIRAHIYSEHEDFMQLDKGWNTWDEFTYDFEEPDYYRS